MATRHRWPGSATTPSRPSDPAAPSVPRPASAGFFHDCGQSRARCQCRGVPVGVAGLESSLWPHALRGQHLAGLADKVPLPRIAGESRTNNHRSKTKDGGVVPSRLNGSGQALKPRTGQPRRRQHQSRRGDPPRSASRLEREACEPCSAKEPWKPPCLKGAGSQSMTLGQVSK